MSFPHFSLRPTLLSSYISHIPIKADRDEIPPSAAAPRPMHGSNMMLEAKRWLEKAFPFWKRRNGRDHIWLAAADEGACWMPTEVYQNSIVLTHWGRCGGRAAVRRGWGVGGNGLGAIMEIA